MTDQQKSHIELEYEEHRGIHFLRFPPDSVFDEHSAGSIREQLTEHLFDEQSTSVVLELSQAIRFDSTALGVLVGGYKRARAIGHKPFVIDNIQSDKKNELPNFLKATGLGKVLPVILEGQPKRRKR